jgi:ribulose-5-phosphate 4-epimerase/fuculose-1-phosphate aldolase
MRDRPIMMMAHHGVTVTGSTVAEALDSFYYLEVAARFQILAASTGDELRVMSEETADRLAPGFQLLNEQTTGHFSAIRRILDREEPEYST